MRDSKKRLQDPFRANYNYIQGEAHMVHYDPKLDRSEEAGWKKYCDEAVPTEAEQKFWGNVMIGYALFTIVMLYVIA